MKIIAGNWKMHGTRESARALVQGVLPALRPEAEVIFCPPFPLLAEVGTILKGAHLGAQDCHFEREGAHTGDVSPVLLREFGCRYVIVGHSERRAGHSESSELVRQKAEAAVSTGLIPIVCVGESRQQREAGQAEAVVAEQVQESAPKGEFILAYEPIWAIGTGLTPTLADIAAMHRHIKALADVPVLYGGSVKASNAKEILHLPGVDGVLVGGASLNKEEFCKIIESTKG